MRENLRICSLILLVAGAVLAWVAHDRGQARAELESSGIEVSGTIMEASVTEKAGRRSGKAYWLQIKYVPQGGEEALTARFEVTPSFFNKVADGETIHSRSVPIVYLPDDPRGAIVRGGSTLAGGSFVVNLMLMLSGAGLIVFLLTLAGRKRSPANVRTRLTDDFQWLPEVMGRPPRDWSVFEGLWWFFKSKCSSSAVTGRWAWNMRINGLALWAVRIKANRKAYDPGSKQSAFYGLVLLAPELPVRMASASLLPVAKWIWHHRGKWDPGWSSEIEEFMKWVDNDLVQGWEKREVPLEITGGLRCVVVTGIFRKADMPGRAMAMELMPMLYDPNDNVATLVPPKFWPKSYKVEWLNELKKNPSNTAADDEESDDLAAFEVTGLPPGALLSVEATLLDICASRQIECLFLNTGSLQDSDRNVILSSGELQFLGRFSQWEDIVATIKQVIRDHVPAPGHDSVEMRTVNLEEFCGRFGWLMDELRSRQSDGSHEGG